MALARLEHARREAEAITREQRRIASEMHDSLGHRLVLIGLQAQTLRGRVSRGDSDLAAAVEEADTIQATAQAALTDLRDVVGALGRSGGVTGGRRNPALRLLTRRQLEVVRLIAQGKPNAEIATTLGMSENTVRIHVSAILKTLGLANRTQAALWATQNLASEQAAG